MSRLADLAPSTGSAESPHEMMWRKSAPDPKWLEPAENGAISRSFHPRRSAGSKGEDCYTFEHFASHADVIHTAYYYHYKRTSSVLKEETKWS